MTKRILSIVVLLTVAFIGAFAAGQGEAMAAGEKTKLVFWDHLHFVPAYNEMQSARLKEFEAQNPNITIEYIPVSGTGTQMKYTAAIESKTAPDIGMLENQFISLFYPMNVLVDVSDLMKKIDKAEGPFTESIWSNATVAGKQWAIPYFFQSQTMYYRTDLLDQVGASYPETWQELKETSRKITKNTDSYGLGIGVFKGADSEFSLRSCFWAFGGKLVEKDGKTVAVKSPESLEALKFMADMFGDEEVSVPGILGWTNSTNNKAYLTGQVAFIDNAGSVLWTAINENNPIVENTSVGLMPKGPAGRFMASYSYHYGIFNTSESIDSSEKVIEFLMDRQYRGEITKKVAPANQPVYAGMDADPFWKKPL